jgi:hypothetical protein
MQRIQRARPDQTADTDQLHHLINRQGYGDDPLDIEHFLGSERKTKAANRIKGAIKRKAAERVISDKTFDNAIEDFAATKLQAAIKRKTKNSDYSKSLASINQFKKETDAANILQAAAKRKDVQSMYNLGAKPIVDAASTIKAATRQKLARNALSEQKEAATKIKAALRQKITRNELSGQQEAATKIQKIARGAKARKDVPKLIEQKLRNDAIYRIGPPILEKANASFTLQAAIRRKNADKEIGNRVWQKVVDDTNAATKIQKVVRGEQVRKEVKSIKDSKDKIGAVVKRLLTERAKTNINPDTNELFINNKRTVGQRLAYSDRQKRLVSKQRRDAAIEGYKNKIN